MSDIGEKSIFIAGGRRRGRPPAQEQSTGLTTWVPNRFHDQLIKLANERSMSVSALVKTLLIRQLQRP